MVERECANHLPQVLLSYMNYSWPTSISARSAWRVRSKPWAAADLNWAREDHDLWLAQQLANADRQGQPSAAPAQRAYRHNVFRWRAGNRASLLHVEKAAING